MPTNRPRYVLTGTDDLNRALADAGRVWPSDKGRPSRLLHRLIAEGHRSVRTDRAAAVARRRVAITESAGRLTGCYGGTYLEDLRDDWPS